MKWIFTSLIFLFTISLNAQSLTGVWRGKFQQNNLDVYNSTYSTETYKYEVQINNLESNALEGVTYSYLSTIFYGKAALKGMFNKKGKTLTIKETVMLDMKAFGKTEPCLMTCYLDYSKIGKLEILSGTYTSIKAKDKSDCGSGTVYLERVAESDFEKEDFLVKKSVAPKPESKLTEQKSKEQNSVKKNDKSPKNESVVSNKKQQENLSDKNKIIGKNARKNNNTNAVKKSNDLVANKPKTVKPGAETFVIDKTKKQNNDTLSTVINKSDDIKNKESKPEEPVVKIIEEPQYDVLIDRENKLVNKIIVDDKNVLLEFYDNGEIDNDTISIFKDNKLVVDKRRLSTSPIRLNLKFDDVNTYYEIITVAENLGDIPPNTALMVITYGNNKRREVFLTSDEKTNAKVIIEYKK